MLTAEKFDDRSDLELQKLSVPGWGEDVYVRTINLGQHKAFMAKVKDDEKDTHGLVLLLLTMTLCDSDGLCLYDWKNADDAERLAKKRMSALENAYITAAKLNLLYDGDDEDEDDLVGKSEAAETNGSPSG